MKLEKAIELLQYSVFVDYHDVDPALAKAVTLGIEALKRIQKYRPAFSGQHPPLLPGETEE